MTDFETGVENLLLVVPPEQLTSILCRISTQEHMLQFIESHSQIVNLKILKLDLNDFEWLETLHPITLVLECRFQVAKLCAEKRFNGFQSSHLINFSIKTFTSNSKNDLQKIGSKYVNDRSHWSTSKMEDRDCLILKMYISRNESLECAASPLFLELLLYKLNKLQPLFELGISMKNYYRLF